MSRIRHLHPHAASSAVIAVAPPTALLATALTAIPVAKPYAAVFSATGFPTAVLPAAVLPSLPAAALPA